MWNRLNSELTRDQSAWMATASSTLIFSSCTPAAKILAAKVAALKATVIVLLILLVKSNLLRLKMSLVGSLLASLLAFALFSTISGGVLLAIAMRPSAK